MVDWKLIQFEHVITKEFYVQNREYIFLIVGSGIGFHYLLGKYFGKRKGQFINITKTSNVVKNPTFMENVPTHFINGWKLKIACWLMNTRFGQWYLRSIILEASKIELVRTSICDFKLWNNRNRITYMA